MYPVWLRRGSSHFNPNLELILYQGRVQLATHDALYSDGMRYLPAKALVKYLKPGIGKIKNVLVLGTGLGSIVELLDRAGAEATYTLVEIDNLVLDWARERLEELHIEHINPVCMDAERFAQRNDQHFDLVFIDIFKDRRVPGFARSAAFLEWCRDRVQPGGYVGFNYMVDDPVEWIDILELFKRVFEQHKLLDLGVNKVFVGW